MPDTNQNHTPERRPAQPQNGARRQESQPQSGGKRQAPRPRARKRRRRPIVLTVLIRIFQIIGTLLLIGVITGCFMVCFAVIYVKTSIMPKTYLNLDDYTMDENSVIVYEDKDTGELKELQTLVGSENRELVEYSQIPEDLINAFVAIEDKRFWNHQGVDWMGTARGLSRLFTGGNIQGGSTIDQQLIKNLTGRDDVTVTRKILEIFTALELENNYKKEVILTTYLNKIYLGNGCSGVQAAAQYYFGKNVWELDLAECASLAGITNNPSLYAPRGTVDIFLYQCQECKKTSTTKDEVCGYCGAENSYDNGSVWTNREYNKARQELILAEMAREDQARDNKAYITEAERDAAIAETLVFTWDKKDDPDNPDEPVEDTKTSSHYSWYTEAVISEAIQVLMEHTQMSEKTCTDRVFSGGLTIVCAYDPEAQAAVDTVFNDRSNLDQVSSKTGQRLMAAISLVDNSTGYVVAMGSTEEKTVDRGWNTPVQTVRQPGSSIKPLSVYGPAIEMGLITPASVVDDNPYLLDGNVWPLNVSATYRGLTTVQYAVTVSLNTVALRVVEMLTPEASYDFMVNKFGFTSLEPYRETSTGRVLSDIDRSPLSMGGLTDGVSTFEMAAAYATFPRNGKFTKATTVLEIRDANGNVIVDNRPASDFIIKETTAYYINSLLTNVVNGSGGTGWQARIPGQTVAGKTGTTNNVFDYWFCGYTNYYTAAVWSGYSNSEVVNNNHANPTVPLWQKVMAILHEDKENVPFDVPGTLNSYSICLDCGKLATADCELDIRGSRTQTFRLFAADAPTEQCTCHVPVEICMDSPILNANGEATGRYHLAGEFCPEETVKTVYMVDYERELAKPSLHIGDEDGLLSWYDSIDESERYCHVHGEGWESDPPEPPETDEPWPSDWVIPGPDESDPPVIPTFDPGVIPTVEPPEPSFDPVFPVDPVNPDSDDAPYIPALDEWGNPISP